MDRWLADKINKHAAGERLLWAKGSADGSILILQFDNHSLTLGRTGGTLVRERQIGPNYQMGARPTEADLAIEDTGIQTLVHRGPPSAEAQRIVDAAAAAIRKASNPFIGVPNDRDNREQIKAICTGIMDDVAKNLGLENVVRVEVTSQGDGEMHIQFITDEEDA